MLMMATVIVEHVHNGLEINICNSYHLVPINGTHIMITDFISHIFSL